MHRFSVPLCQGISITQRLRELDHRLLILRRKRWLGRADDEYVRKLESLGRMRGHETDCVLLLGLQADRAARLLKILQVFQQFANFARLSERLLLPIPNEFQQRS